MQRQLFEKAFRNDGRLIQAVNCGYLKTVVQELSTGDIDLSLTFNGKSFLRIAGERGHKEIARQLILHGANPNEVNGKRKHSLLHTAAFSGNFGFASVLLSEGANPSPRNSHDAAPLHFAARFGYEYLVRKLIEYKADVVVRDSLGRTPIQVALQKGHSQIARLLSNVAAKGHLNGIEIDQQVAEQNELLLNAKLPNAVLPISRQK